MTGGTLLSVLFLVAGVELLSEPCDALYLRLARLPRSPEPTCHGCSQSYSDDKEDHYDAPADQIIVIEEPCMAAPAPPEYQSQYQGPPMPMSYANHPQGQLYDPIMASPSYGPPAGACGSPYEISRQAQMPPDFAMSSVNGPACGQANYYPLPPQPPLPPLPPQLLLPPLPPRMPPPPPPPPPPRPPAPPASPCSSPSNYLHRPLTYVPYHGPPPAPESCYPDYSGADSEGEYQLVYMAEGNAGGCANQYQTNGGGDDSVVVYNKYKKRSNKPEKPSLAYPQQKDPPAIKYRNVKTYERERRSDPINYHDWNENQNRERMFMVYRAEAAEQPGAPNQDNLEVESVIHKALEIAQQQDNAHVRHHSQQQQLQRFGWQPEPVIQPTSSDATPNSAGVAVSDEHEEGEEEEEDWQAGEWSAVPAMPYVGLDLQPETEGAAAEEDGTASAEDAAGERIDAGLETEEPDTESPEMPEDMERPVTFTELTGPESPMPSEPEAA